jgi:hypothetical protein
MHIARSLFALLLCKRKKNKKREEQFQIGKTMSNCFICISSPCETVILHRDLESYPPTPHTPHPQGRFTFLYVFLDRKKKKKKKKCLQPKKKRGDTFKSRRGHLSWFFFFLRCSGRQRALQYRKHARFLYWQDAGASHSLLIILEIQETGTEKW